MTLWNKKRWFPVFYLLFVEEGLEYKIVDILPQVSLNARGKIGLLIRVEMCSYIIMRWWRAWSKVYTIVISCFATDNLPSHQTGMRAVIQLTPESHHHTLSSCSEYRLQDCSVSTPWAASPPNSRPSPGRTLSEDQVTPGDNWSNELSSPQLVCLLQILHFNIKVHVDISYISN